MWEGEGGRAWRRRRWGMRDGSGRVGLTVSLLQEGDDVQLGEVRDQGSDEDSEGEEADVGSALTANVRLASA